MSNNPDPVQIPISADISQLTAALEAGISKAEEFDEQLQRTKKTLQELFLPIPGVITPWSTVQSEVKKLAPEQLSSAISPQFAHEWQVFQQRQKVIDESFRLFAKSPQFNASMPATDMAQAFMKFASMGAGGAGGGANPRPVPITMANDLLQALSRAISNASIPAAVAAVRGGISGNPLAALGGISYAARAGGALGTAGLGIGVAAAGIGAAGFISDTQATYLRRQALLAGATYDQGATGGAPALEMAAIKAGQGFNFDAGQANKTAVQLAMAGVGAGNLMPNMANTFALGRLSGLGPDQIAPLTSALAVQGGMNPQQISAIYQELTNQVKLTGIPMTRLVQDMKDLTRETGNASISVSGLAAVQSIAGNAINVGQLMAPGLGAVGGGALTAAAALGVSPDQFMALQRNPAQMWDAMARMVQQRTRTGGATGTLVSEQLLQSAGLVDWTNIGPKNAARIMTLLRTNQPHAAQQLAATLADKTGNQQMPMPQWIQKSAQATEAQTGAIERLTIAVQNWLAFMVNASPPPPPPGQTDSTGHWTASGGKGSHLIWVKNQPSPPPPHVNGQIAVPNASGSPIPISPQLMAYYQAASKATGVPLMDLLVQGAQESAFNSHAVSSAGAQGIAQFMPATLASLNKQWGTHYNAFNPQQAIMAQARFDKMLEQQYGNYPQALNAYNTGSPMYGYGPDVVTIAVNMKGQLDVVNPQTGQVIGHVSIDQALPPIKHKPQHNRKATGSSGWAPHHGGSGH